MAKMVELGACVRLRDCARPLVDAAGMSAVWTVANVPKKASGFYRLTFADRVLYLAVDAFDRAQ